MDVLLLNLLVALGVGMLIGLGRERAHSDPAGPSDAGLRTFAIASLGGAVAAVEPCSDVAAFGTVADGAWSFNGLGSVRWGMSRPR